MTICTFDTWGPCVSTKIVSDCVAGLAAVQLLRLPARSSAVTNRWRTPSWAKYAGLLRSTVEVMVHCPSGEALVPVGRDGRARAPSSTRSEGLVLDGLPSNEA